MCHLFLKLHGVSEIVKLEGYTYQKGIKNRSQILHATLLNLRQLNYMAFTMLQLCSCSLVMSCLSVRQTHKLGQNERNFCPHSYTIRKADASDFATRNTTRWWGRRLLPEILGQTDAPLHTATFNRYSLVAPQP